MTLPFRNYQPPMPHLTFPNRIMAPFIWFGGKGNLVKKILPYIPKTKIYCEPFAGAASVLFHREPVPIEVLNDIDADIVNLFRVLQDKGKFEELSHRLTWTLYAKAEYNRALKILADAQSSEIDRAWAFFVVQNQTYSGYKSAEQWRCVFVATKYFSYNTNQWRRRLSLLQWWHDRLTRVQIDQRDAIEFIKYWDTPDTAFYVDPPYPKETRKSIGVYTNEPELEYHDKLADTLLNIKGHAVLSTYDHPVYHRLEESGQYDKVEIKTACYAAVRTRKSGLQGKGAAMKKVARTEILYVKKWCKGLFGEVGDL